MFSPRPGGGARVAKPPPYSIASLGHTRAMCPKWPQFWDNTASLVISRVRGANDREDVRSIFGSNLAGAALGTLPGCGLCLRTSSIVWQRLCGAPCTPMTRGLVCGSCSRAAPETYNSRRCVRLSFQDISIPSVGNGITSDPSGEKKGRDEGVGSS